MTKPLEQAFTEASKLSQPEQDSQDQLGKLADEALAEFQKG